MATTTVDVKDLKFVMKLLEQGNVGDAYDILYKLTK
jgi:hypothetical protein